MKRDLMKVLLLTCFLSIPQVVVSTASAQASEPSSAVYQTLPTPDSDYMQEVHFGAPVPDECQTSDFRSMQFNNRLIPEAIRQKLYGIIPGRHEVRGENFFSALFSHPQFFDFLAGTTSQVLSASDISDQSIQPMVDRIRDIGENRRARHLNRWYQEYVRAYWDKVKSCSLSNNSDFQRCEETFDAYGEYYLRYHFNKGFFNLMRSRLNSSQELAMTDPLVSSELTSFMTCLNDSSTSPEQSEASGVEPSRQ